MQTEKVSHRYWTTESELEFLDGLGSFKDQPSAMDLSPQRRLKLLKRYRDAMLLRIEWGKIDPYQVRKAVEHMIDGD